MRRQGEIRDQKSSQPEGQEVSGEDRFDLFGKTDASKGFALAVAGKYERPKHFFLFACKSLKVQKIAQSEIFTCRRAGGFRRTSLSFVRKEQLQVKFAKSEWQKFCSICSVCSERTVAREVRKIRTLEVLFGLFGVLVCWGSK